MWETVNNKVKLLIVSSNIKEAENNRKIKANSKEQHNTGMINNTMTTLLALIYIEYHKEFMEKLQN